MKNFIILTLCALVLSACVSPPEKRTISLPVARAIRLEKDQKILGYPRAFGEYYLVAAGTYRLIGEDKTAWYYANEKEVIRVKNLYPERAENGGIGLSKTNGNYFMYLAKGVGEAKQTARERGGEFGAFGVNSTLNDGVFRFYMSWVTLDFVAEWKFEPESNP